MNEKLKKVLESYCIGRYGPASIEEKKSGFIDGFDFAMGVLGLDSLDTEIRAIKSVIHYDPDKGMEVINTHLESFEDEY